MTYQPPFTITTEIIDLISVVSEQVGFVQRYVCSAIFHFSTGGFWFILRVKKTRQRPCAKVYPWRVALFQGAAL